MVELVTAYLDGSMAEATRVRFERHLAGCRGCAHYLAQLRSTIAILGSLREDQLEPHFRALLLDALDGTAGSW
jgi:anti-sigma factor RsiW